MLPEDNFSKFCHDMWFKMSINGCIGYQNKIRFQIKSCKIYNKKVAREDYAITH